MRESIGTTFILNFIVIFIVFIFAFLAGTLSYYKAFKVNNAIIFAIEKYEGYNELAKAEIKTKLKSLGYQTDNVKYRYKKSSDVNPVLLTKTENGNCVDGYCIFIYFNENAPKTEKGAKSTTNIYYSLGVLTNMRINFPVIGSMLYIPVFSKTYNIYYFQEWDQSAVVGALQSKMKQ